MKHLKKFKDHLTAVKEAKFFDPTSVQDITDEIAEKKITAVQFHDFTYQYRYNGVEANVSVLCEGQTEMEEDHDFGTMIAEYFGPQIRKARNEYLEGEYIIKKFSKWPEVKLLDAEGNPLGSDYSYDVELGSDS